MREDENNCQDTSNFKTNYTPRRFAPRASLLAAVRKHTTVCRGEEEAEALTERPRERSRPQGAGLNQGFAQGQVDPEEGILSGGESHAVL